MEGDDKFCWRVACVTRSTLHAREVVILYHSLAEFDPASACNTRSCVVSLFQDERLTGAVLEFLEQTEIGRRYE
jgi:hypothetical protein